jgi:hypothetical protein
MLTNLGTGVRASLRCALLGLPLHRADGPSWLGRVAVLRLSASASARRRVAEDAPARDWHREPVEELRGKQPPLAIVVLRMFKGRIGKNLRS